MHRLFRSMPSVLCLSALVAACGGGSKPPDPAPSSTLIPIPDPAIACKVLRVTPGDAIQPTFVDPLMTIVYTAPTAGACGDLALLAPGQATVDARVIASSEWPNPQGGYVGTRTIAHVARPIARYGAHVSKISDRSADARGMPVTLSALLIAPEQTPGGAQLDFNGLPVVIGQRGATGSESGAPSSGATTMAIPGLIAAGKGHLFLAPDLIGVGDTGTLPQAYLVAADTAGQTQDLLRAARAHVQQRHQARLGTDLRLFGGSQGAYSTIASLPHLAREGTVRTVSAAQGPYDVYRTFHGALLAAGGAARDAYAMHENLDFLPSHVRDVMTSFQAYGNYPFDPQRVFDTDGKLLPSFLADYKDGHTRDFVRQLGANNLVAGSQVYDLPQAQVQLYHFSTDALVPAQNTEDLLVALSGQPHRFAGVQRGNCHENSELVKLIVRYSKSKLTTHTLCVAFQIDDFVGGL